MIFGLLHEKSIVTTTIADGQKKTMNLSVSDLQDIHYNELKDGTIIDPAKNTGGQIGEIEKYFAKKKLPRNKKEKFVREEIEDSSEEVEEVKELPLNSSQPHLVSFKFKKEISEKAEIS